MNEKQINSAIQTPSELGAGIQSFPAKRGKQSFNYSAIQSFNQMRYSKFVNRKS
ncbi:MAG TPA: hypothetical protein VMT35_15750 [Ignavibacteriaceae bacterium]|nr:hypothetical protein [Ignavibacteriaceae bacterium]